MASNVFIKRHLCIFGHVKMHLLSLRDYKGFYEGPASTATVKSQLSPSHKDLQDKAPGAVVLSQWNGLDLLSRMRRAHHKKCCTRHSQDVPKNSTFAEKPIQPRLSTAKKMMRVLRAQTSQKLTASL